jgi:hypothetical protein
MSCRRYTLISAPGDDDDGGDVVVAEVVEEVLSPEEATRREAVVAAKRAEKEARLIKAEAEKEAEAFRRRALAEAGLGEHKFIQKSKKELEEVCRLLPKCSRSHLLCMLPLSTSPLRTRRRRGRASTTACYSNLHMLTLCRTTLLLHPATIQGTQEQAGGADGEDRAKTQGV